jgi:pimeloyl-ACP methyl ester carboxylesterase
MNLSADAEVVAVPRGPYRLRAEYTPGPGGTPVVLMHGFPDNLHLYDRLLPHLAGRVPVVRFDFLGWGGSDKPRGYPYTADRQGEDLAAVVDHFGFERVLLVAHDASGPPAIDWALANPARTDALVLLNTYYQWMVGLRRPPAIALYSTPVIRAVARAAVRRWPGLDRRLYAWQVGQFIQDPDLRADFVPSLYADFGAARPAFWRLNDDLLGAVLSRLARVPDLRRFDRPVRIVFGARDRYLNRRVAARFRDLFPHAELHLLPDAGHYVQVDEPAAVAAHILQQVASRN